MSVFSFVGALLTAFAIYVLAWRNGIAGYRLVLVGIGIAAMLYSVIDYLMTRANIWDAQVALRWLTGSLNGIVERNHAAADDLAAGRCCR